MLKLRSLVVALILIALPSLAFAQTVGSVRVKELKYGSGSPEGSVAGSPGDLYVDQTNFVLYLKAEGTGDSSRDNWSVVVRNTGTTAPVDATYLTKTSNSTLTAEQALSALSTGLMNVTTSTGAVTSIVPTDDNVVVGNGTAWQLKALTDCQGSGKAVTYTASSNTFGCNTIDSLSVTALTEHALFGTSYTPVATGTGNLPNGVHYYAIAFVDAAGNMTRAMDADSATTDNSHKQVDITDIPLGPTGTVSRAIFRSYVDCPPVDCDYLYLLHTIADNTTTSYTDNNADAVLDYPLAPQTNTSGPHLSAGDGGVYFSGHTMTWDLGTGDGFNDSWRNSGYPWVAGVIDTNGESISTMRFFPNYLGIGADALLRNAGSNNVAIGPAAMGFSTGGTQNTAVGTSALYEVASNDNTAIGQSALSHLTSGSENAAGGSSALNALTTGNFNAAWGMGALRAATTGSSQAALGQDAGRNITTGTQNTVLGSIGCETLTTGSNNVCLGFNSDVPAASTSNMVVIGNASVTNVRIPGLKCPSMQTGTLTIDANGEVTRTCS